MKVLAFMKAQPCSTLCNPMDFSPPGSSVHGILQARILEWVAIFFSRDLPDPGIEPWSPTLQADALPSAPPGKLQELKATPNRAKVTFLLHMIRTCSSDSILHYHSSAFAI